MMVMLKIAVFVIGFAVVAGTLLSAVQTFVLPRAANVFLTRTVFRAASWLFRFRANKTSTYEATDQVMAMFAPVTLLVLPIVWLILAAFGYTAMYWALGIQPLYEAFRLSGSSLLTLGFALASDLPTTMLALSEATIGLGLVALLIAYLPTMYSAFSKREALVAMLEVRAGAPPSAIQMIQRAQRIRGGFDYFVELWEQWEIWFVEVEESHTSFGALAFFRSPQPDRSWVTAAGAILDCAALLASTVDTPRTPQAQLCIRAGYLCLRHIADFFRLPYNSDPAPTDPISITREEFDEAYDELAAAGVPLKPDRDQAWRDYAGWRVNYDTVLLALAALTMAPFAPWSSDRSLRTRRTRPSFWTGHRRSG